MVAEPGNPRRREQAQPDEPPGPPERRDDYDLELRVSVTPDAVAVADHDRERVVPGRHMGVVRRPARARLDPVAFQPVQPVFERQTVRLHEAETRVGDLEALLSRRDPDHGVERHRGLIDRERLDPHGHRGRRADVDSFRIDHGHAILRREP